MDTTKTSPHNDNENTSDNIPNNQPTLVSSKPVSVSDQTTDTPMICQENINNTKNSLNIQPNTTDDNDNENTSDIPNESSTISSSVVSNDQQIKNGTPLTNLASRDSIKNSSNIQSIDAPMTNIGKDTPLTDDNVSDESETSSIIKNTNYYYYSDNSETTTSPNHMGLRLASPIRPNPFSPLSRHHNNRQHRKGIRRGRHHDNSLHFKKINVNDFISEDHPSNHRSLSVCEKINYSKSPVSGYGRISSSAHHNNKNKQRRANLYLHNNIKDKKITTRVTTTRNCSIALEHFLSHIGPTGMNIAHRQSLFAWTQELIIRAISSHASLGQNYYVDIVCFGSVPLRSYLFNADIDVGVMVRPKLSDGSVGKTSDTPSFVEREVLDTIESALFSFKKNGDNYIGQSSDVYRPSPDALDPNIYQVPSKVRILKFAVDDVSMDISVNKTTGCLKLPFLEVVNEIIGHRNLFKKSLILIKAYLSAECVLLGADKGLLSSYAVEVMLLCVFSVHHFTLEDTYSVLCAFCKYYSQFDFSENVISAIGPIKFNIFSQKLNVVICQSDETTRIHRFNITSIEEDIVTSQTTQSPHLLKIAKLVTEYRKTFVIDNFKTEKSICLSDYAFFEPRPINIADPIDPMNNLGRSVTVETSYRLSPTLLCASRRLGSLCLLTKAPMNDPSRLISCVNGVDLSIAFSNLVLLTKFTGNQEGMIDVMKSTGISWLDTHSGRVVINELMSTFIFGHQDFYMANSRRREYEEFLHAYFT